MWGKHVSLDNNKNENRRWNRFGINSQCSITLDYINIHKCGIEMRTIHLEFTNHFWPALAHALNWLIENIECSMWRGFFFFFFFSSKMSKHNINDKINHREWRNFIWIRAIRPAQVQAGTEQSEHPSKIYVIFFYFSCIGLHLKITAYENLISTRGTANWLAFHSFNAIMGEKNEFLLQTFKSELCFNLNAYTTDWPH